MIIAGGASVVLGVIGIFLPLLPTTPFLLLAAVCFGKSSDRCHRWLLSQRYLGPYIKLYLDGAGLPLKAKVYIIGLLWVTIGSSVIFFVKALALKVMLLAIAAGVTFYLARLPSYQMPSPEPPPAL